MAAVQIVAQFSPGLFQNGALLGLAEVFRSPDTAVMAEKTLVIGCLSDLYAQTFAARADKFDGGDTLAVRRRHGCQKAKFPGDKGDLSSGHHGSEVGGPLHGPVDARQAAV